MQVFDLECTQLSMCPWTLLEVFEQFSRPQCRVNLVAGGNGRDGHPAPPNYPFNRALMVLNSGYLG